MQKLFGWFGGPGLNRVKLGFEKQGFRPVWPWIILAIVGEVGGGLSVALGFLTPLGAAGIFGAMAMATFKSHWKNGFWLNKGGYEYSLMLLIMSYCHRLDRTRQLFAGYPLWDQPPAGVVVLRPGSRCIACRCCWHL